MSSHVLIAGTGRAGTSFLVRYLTLLGLETNLSRNGPDAPWDDRANAGLEDILRVGAIDLPYVIKSPWTYQTIHDALDSGQYQFDGVILPIRDLTEAAASRTIVELEHIHDNFRWMGDLDRPWEEFGHTPGGIVFSLNPVDQARLLAVGFHRLLERLVRDDIPVVLIGFPRLIEDPAYLHAKLAPILPRHVSLDEARAAHAATADPLKVRVGRELAPDAGGFAMDGPGPERLERAALQRLLASTRLALRTAETQSAEAMQAMRGAETARDDAVTHRLAAEQAFGALQVERDRDGQRFRALEDARAEAAQAHAALQSRLEHRLEEMQAERDRVRDERDAARRELALIRGSMRTFLRHYWPHLRGFLLRR